MEIVIAAGSNELELYFQVILSVSIQIPLLMLRQKNVCICFIVDCHGHAVVFRDPLHFQLASGRAHQLRIKQVLRILVFILEKVSFHNVAARAVLEALLVPFKELHLVF
jgi:hypothetical protein